MPVATAFFCRYTCLIPSFEGESEFCMTIEIDLDDCDGIVGTEYDDTDDLIVDGFNFGTIDFPIDGFMFNPKTN